MQRGKDPGQEKNRNTIFATEILHGIFLMALKKTIFLCWQGSLCR
jgi:hypothetical protein